MLAPGAFLHADGNKEDRLQRAEELIAAQEYNEAYVLLSQLIQENPEYFDKAQELIGSINQISRGYNDKLQDLVEAIERNDQEQVLEIYDQLASINPNPNAATAQALSAARRTANLVFNRNLLLQLLDATLVKVNEGQYQEAALDYLQAFAFFREDFQQAGHGPLVVSTMESAIESIDAAVREFAALAPQVDASLGRLGSAETAALAALSGQLAIQLERVAGLTDTVVSAAEAIGRQNQLIQQADARGEDDVYLRFVRQTISGRASHDGLEGIEVVMDRFWSGRTQDAVVAFLQRSGAAYDQAQAILEQGEIKLGEQALQNAAALYIAGLPLLAAPAERAPQSQLLTAAGSQLRQQVLPNLLLAQDRTRRAATLPALSRSVLDDLGEPGAVNRAVLSQRGATLQTRRESLASSRDEWQEVAGRLEGVVVAGVEVDQLAAEATELAGRLQAGIDLLVAREIGYTAPVMVAEGQQLKQQYDQHTAGIDVGRGLLEGVEAETGTVHLPLEARSLFQELTGQFAQLREQVAAYVTDWQPDGDRLQSESLRSIVADTEMLTAQITTRAGELSALIDAATAQAFRAEQFKVDGQAAIDVAQRDIQATAFAAACGNLERAAGLLYESLVRSEDADVRSLIDVTIPALGENVAQAEIAAVQQEVRALITQARDRYNLAQFVDAERVLVRAQDRWADVRVDENTEITNWLNLVRQALTANTGRELAETDPLFPVMQARLDLAQRAFKQGKTLLAEGQRQAAAQKLDQAEAELEKVKASFPHNRDARVLSLQIREVRDPVGFQDSLLQDFRIAMNQRGSNAQEAYSQLQDIKALKPDFPGVDAALLQLEYDLGIRARPVDNSLAIRASQLVTQARQLFSQGDQERYVEVTTLLDQALQLNPNNTAAATLKDQVTLAQGATVTVFLSSSAQEQYRSAQQSYIDGDYVNAFRIVQTLLQERRNAGYPPLLDLKKRIDARI